MQSCTFTQHSSLNTFKTKVIIERCSEPVYYQTEAEVFCEAIIGIFTSISNIFAIKKDFVNTFSRALEGSRPNTFCQKVIDVFTDVKNTSLTIDLYSAMFGYSSDKREDKGKDIISFSLPGSTFHLTSNTEIMESIQSFWKSMKKGHFGINESPYTQIVKSIISTSNPLKDCILYCDEARGAKIKEAMVKGMRFRMEANPSNAQEILDDLIHQLEKLEDIDALDFAAKFTTKFICESVLEHEVSFKECEEIYKAAQVLNEKPMLILFKEASFSDKDIQDGIKKMQETVDAIYNKQGSLVRYLAAENLSFEEIKCTLLSILLGGTETSATLISHSLYHLGKNPLLQKSIVEHGDTETTFKNIAKLFAESLRHCPSAFMTVREANEDLKISYNENTYYVKKGELIAMLHFTAAKDEAYECPHAFDIQRNNTQSLNWRPFGGGKNRCAGEKVVTYEFREFMHYLLSEYEIFNVWPEKLDFTGKALLKTELPITFSLKKI